MLSIKQMDTIMSFILALGTLFSLLLVMTGGGLYLLQHGNEMMNTESLQTTIYPFFSPLGMIKSGLVALIATQILRIGLLVWFYAVLRDYRFTFISFFILAVLLYSSFLRN